MANERSLSRPDEIEIGETAYRAYAAAMGWKNWNGEPMRPWAVLSAQQRIAWRASVEAVLERTK